MIFALLLAALILLAVAVSLCPLFRRADAAPDSAAYDLEIYRDQLTEIECDVTRGTLTPEQAAAAKTEIRRRMLALEESRRAAGAKNAPNAAPRTHRRLGISLAIGVALLSLLFYAALGAPQLVVPSLAPKDARAGTGAKIDAAERQILNQIRVHPNAEGYARLGQLYFATQRFDQATDAFRKVIGMTGGNADIWSDLGESITLSNDGHVGPEAQQAFVHAVKMNKMDARARYYLGLAEAQSGHVQKAIALWRALEKDSPSDAPWLGLLKERISAYAKGTAGSAASEK